MRNGIEYFVFSTAGKLVFASHQAGDGEDEDGQASTRVGVLQTLISIYADDAHDRLRHITLSDSLSIVFLLRPPLYLTAVSHHAQGQPSAPPALLRIHLDALHLQLTSIVPAPKLNKLYAQRPNYDLRARMLTGTEPFLHSLIGSLQQSHAPSSSAAAIGTEGGWPWLLGALQPIKLDPSLRAKLGQALQPPALSTSASASPTLTSASSTAASTLSLLNPVAYLTTPSSSTIAPISRPKDLLYVLVLFRSQLVTLLRPRKHSVHAADMHLLINAARASIRSRSKAERSSTLPEAESAAAALAEDLISWVPVCLPRFAAGGFVWAHVSLLPKSTARSKGNSAAGQSSLSSSASAISHSRPPTPGHGPATGSRTSGLPTNHVSTAVAVPFLPSTSSAKTTLHVPDSSTAQAVASAMRSSLRSASTSRASSPLPSPLLSSAASSFPSSPLIPSSPSSCSSSSASQEPDETIKQDERAGLPDDDEKQVGDRKEEGTTDRSETSSIAESDTPSHSHRRDIDASTMDEAQEAELMASISALRSGPVTPLPTPGVEGKQSLSIPSQSTDPPQDAEAAETERRRKANYFAENLEEEDDLTLVLVSGDPEAFASLSLWRNHIISTLQSSSILSQLLRKLNISASAAATGAGPAKSSYSADELRIPGLRHFIYKSRTATQLTAPRYEAPYVSSSANSPTSAVDPSGETQHGSKEAERELDADTDTDGGEAWRRLTGLYGLVWDGIHAPQAPSRDMFGLKPPREDSASISTSDTVDEDESGERDSSDPSSSATHVQGDNPTLHKWTSASSSYAFVRTEHEAVLGWLTSAFELYICVSPWIRRKAVITMASKVAKWVKDKEEELFLVAPPVF